MHHLIGKAEQKQLLRFCQPHSPRAQVKQLLRIELSYGGTVTALHVIGVNFELRLGVRVRRFAQQQRATSLLRDGLLRALAHKHATAKINRSVTRSHLLKQLGAAAICHAVLHKKICAVPLRERGCAEGKNVALCVFALQIHVQVLHHLIAAQREVK